MSEQQWSVEYSADHIQKEITMDEDCCVVCHYYRKRKPSGYGNCHRFPPVPNQRSMDRLEWTESEFPIVRRSQWCGEFKRGRPNEIERTSE